MVTARPLIKAKTRTCYSAGSARSPRKARSAGKATARRRWSTSAGIAATYVDWCISQILTHCLLPLFECTTRDVCSIVTTTYITRTLFGPITPDCLPIVQSTPFAHTSRNTRLTLFFHKNRSPCGFVSARTTFAISVTRVGLCPPRIGMTIPQSKGVPRERACYEWTTRNTGKNSASGAPCAGR